MTIAANASVLVPRASSAADLGGLAALGRIALALLIIVAVIFLCAWLLRRMAPGGGTFGQRLKLVAARAVGPKERVVILEVEGTWLVLGVAAGGITKLHELPAGKPDPGSAHPGDGGFGARLASALKQNLGGHRP